MGLGLTEQIWYSANAPSWAITQVDITDPHDGHKSTRGLAVQHSCDLYPRLIDFVYLPDTVFPSYPIADHLNIVRLGGGPTMLANHRGGEREFALTDFVDCRTGRKCMGLFAYRPTVDKEQIVIDYGRKFDTTGFAIL